MVPPVPHRARVARGPRGLEGCLLGELEPLLADRDATALALPIRVVVPSRSLRLHLARCLARRFRALAGVKLQTLHALALEILERVGAAPPPGDLLFPIAVRECARAEPVLCERLDALVDGYGVVEASVSDLLDAGFEPAHADPMAEAIETATSPGERRERGLALARVAARSAETLERWGIGHRSRLLRSAREALEADPVAALPAREVFVYGFADATAVQADLVDALLRHRDARIFLDRPADPADPSAVDPGLAFGERFARRISGVVPGFDEDAEPPSPASIEVLHAPGVQAEVRAVGDRVRALLDAGTAPEDVGVVARQLGPYAAALRLHFRRLGVPFSGVAGTGPAGPAGRRVQAFLSLLRLRERTPAELWLDVLETLPDRELDEVQRADLLLGLHVLGAARLGDVAALPTFDEDLRLPVRLGLAKADAGSRRPPRRRLSRALLEAARSAAAHLVARFAAWPASAAVGAHLEQVRELASTDLRWRESSPGRAPLHTALFDAGGALPDAVEMDLDALGLFVERALAGVADQPLGGRGAGVQVLDVMEARERTFEHLFVIGISRDAFPRAISEDPLLEDRVRRQLRDVLEDLPIKAEGHDEERFLFAQLLAAAPRVTLSAPVSDEDGRARPVSPLLDRLRWSSSAAAPTPVPALYARGATSAPRPAHEHAILAGLHASRNRFERTLVLALEESARELGVSDPSAARALGRVRTAVLAELDPDLRAPRRLGPYYGFVGPPGDRDPRLANVYVTTFEQIARCPWQAFLTRLLRVESVPDPHAELPSAEPASTALLVGSLVHRVLERIVRDALGDVGESVTLEDAVRREPRAVPWPSEAERDALVGRCARELVREEGIGLPGYAPLLALLAREPLAQAGRLDWPDAGSGFGALGAEVEGHATLPGGRGLHFLADRLDGDGSALRLVDYKTGRPPALQKTPAIRRRRFLDEVAGGRMLQAVAYARAGAALGAATEGRYLYLKPGDALPQRVFAARADEVDFAEAFEGAAAAALQVFEQGSFAPRLIERGGDDENHSCERCSVKEACLRGDSGARRRLAAWIDARAGAADAADSAPERALLTLWHLDEGGA